MSIVNTVAEIKINNKSFMKNNGGITIGKY